MVYAGYLTNPSINGGSPVKILISDFGYGWKSNVNSDSQSNSFESVESVFTGWENPIINVSIVMDVDNVPSGYLTWELWNSFVKNEYDSSDSNTVTTFNLNVGTSGVAFKDYSTSSAGVSDIRVVVKSFSLKFSPRTSKRAGFWTINAQFSVTK